MFRKIISYALGSNLAIEKISESSRKPESSRKEIRISCGEALEHKFQQSNNRLAGRRAKYEAAPLVRIPALDIKQSLLDI